MMTTAFDTFCDAKGLSSTERARVQFVSISSSISPALAHQFLLETNWDAEKAIREVDKRNGGSVQKNLMTYPHKRRPFQSERPKILKDASSRRGDSMRLNQTQILDATYLKPPDAFRIGPLTKCSAMSVGDFAALGIPLFSMGKEWPISLSENLTDCQREPSISVLVSHCSGLRAGSLYQLEVSVDESGPRRSGWYEAGKNRCEFHTAFKFTETPQTRSAVRIAVWERHIIRGNHLKGEIVIPLDNWDRESKKKADVLIQTDIPLAQKITLSNHSSFSPRITYAVVLHRQIQSMEDFQSRSNTTVQEIEMVNISPTKSPSRRKISGVFMPKILHVLRRASPSPINYYRCQTPSGVDDYKSIPSSGTSSHIVKQSGRQEKQVNHENNTPSTPPGTRELILPPATRPASSSHDPPSRSTHDATGQDNSLFLPEPKKSNQDSQRADESPGHHDQGPGDHDGHEKVAAQQDTSKYNDVDVGHCVAPISGGEEEGGCYFPPRPSFSGASLTRELFLRNAANEDGAPSDDDFWKDWVLRTRSEVDGIETIPQGRSRWPPSTPNDSSEYHLWTALDRREIAHGVQSSLYPQW